MVMKNSIYSIEFTEEQLRCTARALEFYSRFLAGQWRIPDAMQHKEYEVQNKPEDFWDKRNYIEDQLNVLSVMFTGMPPHGSYGIGHKNLEEDAKTSYDIYRPILEELVGKNADSWNVYSSPGLSYSKEGRIKVNVLL